MRSWTATLVRSLHRTDANILNSRLFRPWKHCGCFCAFLMLAQATGTRKLQIAFDNCIDLMPSSDAKWVLFFPNWSKRPAIYTHFPGEHCGSSGLKRIIWNSDSEWRDLRNELGPVNQMLITFCLKITERTAIRSMAFRRTGCVWQIWLGLLIRTNPEAMRNLFNFHRSNLIKERVA